MLVNQLMVFKTIDQILMDQLLLQAEETNANEAQFDTIEMYLIKTELIKIKENILSNMARDEYHILLRDNYLVFRTPIELVNTSVINTISQLKEMTDRLALNSIVFTGRFTKYQLIQETLKTLFKEDEKMSMRIDTQNEMKSKGILFN